MTKTILALAFVSAFAYHAMAEDDFIKTGTSVEDNLVGVLDVEFEETSPAGIYWATNSSDGAVVTEYGTEKPYDYEARHMERDDLFGDRQEKYLALDVDIPTERLALSRPAGEGVVSDLKVATTNYSGIYVDTLVKFTPCVMAPDVDSKDRIVVWLYEHDEGEVTKTNLMITAGRYVGGFDKIERHDYMVSDPEGLDAGWHRLTIRTIPDVTGVKKETGTTGVKAAGYEVYIDGEPALADEATYSVGAGYRDDWLTPQARMLINQGRLFPALTQPGHDGSTTLTRLAFAGMGAVDDMLFTTNQPSHIADQKVFTLEWDAGVKSMTCVVAYNGEDKDRFTVDATTLPRYHDFLLADATEATVTISDVVYDTASAYSKGVWVSGEDCTLSGNVFTYKGESMTPGGAVRSTREFVKVGEGGYQTFAEARARLKQEGKRVIELHTNLVITTGNISGYRDNGYFAVADGDDIVLDLMGHTLQGAYSRVATIYQTGGKLRITDSVGGGRVLPMAGVSVRSNAESKNLPELTIAAGTYDGSVVVTGKVASTSMGGTTIKYIGTCVIDGGVFTNAYPEQATFYLNQYVTNATTYYALSGGYWSPLGGASYVWSGKGANARWDNVENWQCKKVPTATDLAVFPHRADGTAWSVDFGEGVAAKRFRLDADISMTGTNEFSNVVVEGGTNRLVGAGVAMFTGRIPGALTAAGVAPDGQIRLGASWQGTVKIANINRATNVVNIITGWGFAGSTVEFSAVRAYAKDGTKRSVPYNLVLTDAGENPAWESKTGDDGSSLCFPKLSGSGTFSVPAISEQVRQTYQFKDVSEFTGAFSIASKRILLGEGDVAVSAEVGSITFADAVSVRSGKKWTGVNAYFGASINVNGAFEDTLMTYTGDVAPEVSDVKVYMSNGATGCLQVVEKAIVIKPISVTFGKTVSLCGRNVLASTVAKKMTAGDTLTVPSDSSVTISGNDVLVDNKVVSTVADYYKLTVVDADEGTYKVELDEAEATPSLNKLSMEVDEESGLSFVRFNVENTKSELWYGIETSTSLADGWQAPRTWEQAKGTSLELTAIAAGASGFYRVVVTDKDPSAGSAE